MSHFYGRIQGNRGAATRCGSKANGHDSNIAGWRGQVHVRLWHDDNEQTDKYIVSLAPWQNSGGGTTIIAEGELDATKSPEPRFSITDIRDAIDELSADYPATAAAMALIELKLRGIA